MTRLLIYVTLTVLIVGTSDQSWAACGLANERIAKVTVITCDDASETIMKRIQALQAEKPADFDRWLKNLKLESATQYRDWLMDRNPGVILVVKVMRSRELDYLRKQQSPTAPLVRDWDESPQPRGRTYFWHDGTCERLRQEGGTRLLHMPMRCCDTIPASDPECLLNIKPSTDLPEWIIEAGYHE